MPGIKRTVPGYSGGSMTLEDIDDQQLLDRLDALVRQEREDTAEIVAHLSEMDDRSLAIKRGYASLFDYCVRKLGYSEPSAYHRIRAARAVGKKPELLAMLRSGELHLRALVLLHPHLGAEGADELIERAKGKSKREVEAIVAPLTPETAPRDSIHVIAVEKPVVDMPLFALSAPRQTPVETRIRIEFSAAQAFMELLDRVKALLRHKYPDGRLESVFEDALKALLEKRDPDSWLPGKKGVSRTRRVARWVRKQVWARDGGRCAYEADDGTVCGSRGGLQFDHIVPWAKGGSSNDPANVRLLCRAHNRVEAARWGLQQPEVDDPHGL